MNPKTDPRISIKKPSPAEQSSLGIKSWPIWEKEVSTFPWQYDETETCYLLEGKVRVKTATETIEFGDGDLVTFPAGLSCTWEIIKPVRKHYKFG
jgi:uncharacterized cupin superfamily protein